MNTPSMTNEQFALWFAAGQGPSQKLFENARSILDWLEKNEKKAPKPITGKTK